MQNQVNQLNSWNSPTKLVYNQLTHIQHNSSQGSYSSTSDHSINHLNDLNLASDYSFNSSSNSSKNSNTINSMLDTNVQLVNQITMANAMPQQPTISLPNDQIYSIDSTKSPNNQVAIIKKQNTSKFFNDIPTPGLDKNKIKKK